MVEYTLNQRVLCGHAYLLTLEAAVVVAYTHLTKLEIQVAQTEIILFQLLFSYFVCSKICNASIILFLFVVVAEIFFYINDRNKLFFKSKQ
jgi:hypothetical protein